MKKLKKFKDENSKADAKRKPGKVKPKKLEAFDKKLRKNKKYFYDFDDEEE